MQDDFNEHIKPLMDDAVKLQVCTKLPDIVVVGNQGSGKSSVVESLTGIRLPRCPTRVPLIIKLNPSSDSNLHLQLNAQVMDEERLCDAITEANRTATSVSSTPLVLVVGKRDIPKLTFIDLPGLPAFTPAVQRPKDHQHHYQQVSSLIHKYISGNGSIILNVMSATGDFRSCASHALCAIMDPTRQRTLAVITKAEDSPIGGLVEELSRATEGTPGYVFVRNNIGDETIEYARQVERNIFAEVPLRSMGVRALSLKLIHVLQNILSKSFTSVFQEKSKELKEYVLALNQLPKTLTTEHEANALFYRTVGMIIESSRKVLLDRNYVDFSGEQNMQSVSIRFNMLQLYEKELRDHPESKPLQSYLEEEILYLQQLRGFELPNIFCEKVLETIIRKKISSISSIPSDFVENVWRHIGQVVDNIVLHHSKDYDHLHLGCKTAGKSLIETMKKHSLQWLNDYMESEKFSVYTCSGEYMRTYKKLMEGQELFLTQVSTRKDTVETPEGHFRNSDLLKKCELNVLRNCYDLRMKIVSYWLIVRQRFVDNSALHIQLAIKKLVDTELERGILGQFPASINRLNIMESPKLAADRRQLEDIINPLKDFKELLSETMDKHGSGISRARRQG